MRIQDSIVLVTGGNRGLGKALVHVLLAKGAKKIYVGSRTLSESTDPRVHPIQLDITNADEIAAAAQNCQDVTILINNAGISGSPPLLTAPSLDRAREVMDTNYFGTLAMTRAFAPILKRNGGGVLVNMLSVLSWFATPASIAYSASKFAALALTLGTRVELRSQGTLVIAVHAGYIETDMTTHIDAPKVKPEEVAAKMIEGIEQNQEEILADQSSHQVKAALASHPQEFYQQIEQDWHKAQLAAL
jgi:NAD(P)-dependent dehydrogenase (short-subunit alcohol dehydrogenase family)